MILPTKHISEEQSLLGVGAALLSEIKQPVTVTSLWEKVRAHKAVGNFERFILVLDMLYITGLVQFSDGLIRRVRR